MPTDNRSFGFSVIFPCSQGISGAVVGSARPPTIASRALRGCQGLGRAIITAARRLVKDGVDARRECGPPGLSRTLTGSPAARRGFIIAYHLTRAPKDPGEPSLRNDTRPIPPAGLDLHRRAVCDGLHRILHFPDPAIRLLARYERGSDRHARRWAFATRGVFVDPRRRANGPLRDPPGNVILRLDGHGVGAALPAAAVVLVIAAVADRQWRGVKF